MLGVLACSIILEHSNLEKKDICCAFLVLTAYIRDFIILVYLSVIWREIAKRGQIPIYPF